MKKDKIRAGIVGASGYSARELIKILCRHPHVELSYLASRHFSGADAADIHPSLRGVCDLKLREFDPAALAAECDAAFLAVPHGAAMDFALKVSGSSCSIIDVSADFRLKDEALYKKWYDHSHLAPHLLHEAVYGLAEYYFDELKGASLVANPGCYATSILLGALPVLKAGLHTGGAVHIDAKSGASGAGRNPKGEAFLFSECAENIKPYKVARHQHMAEITQTVNELCGGKCPPVCFVPQLVPMNRGILANIYFTVSGSLSASAVEEAFLAAYKGKPFIRLLAPGTPPETKHVWGTNFCDIGWVLDKETGTLVVMTAIDNLVKGASGQAVQNMNIMFGLDETAGLL